MRFGPCVSRGVLYSPPFRPFRVAEKESMEVPVSYA
jgi:hypothetical protein